MDPALEIRATRPDERRAASAATSISLLASPMDDEVWEKRRDGWSSFPSFSAWDGDRCVGHAGQFLVETVVPGGALVATGAVTRVGVLPTHRRRGLATGLMKALIDDASERRLPIMSLRASEAVIYQRFGFGVAGDSHRVRVDATRARPVGAGPSGNGGHVELLDPADVVSTASGVYERALTRRVGQITRQSMFWDRMYENAISQKHGAFVVAHRTAEGAVDGIAHYTIRWSGDDVGHGGGVGDVHDVVAERGEAELALWRYLLDIDLVHTWSLSCRPTDDSIREAIADRRAYRIESVDDEQWVRLVDVDAALTARRYNPVDVSVTIEVSDSMLAVNNGVWRVDRDGVQRDDRAEPELVVDASTLGAAYLGGVSWSSLDSAGHVDTRSADAGLPRHPVVRADQLFAVQPAPFCGTFF